MSGDTDTRQRRNEQRRDEAVYVPYLAHQAPGLKRRALGNGEQKRKGGNEYDANVKSTVRMDVEGWTRDEECARQRRREREHGRGEAEAGNERKEGEENE